MTNEIKKAFRTIVSLGNIVSTKVRDGELYVVYIAPGSRSTRCEKFGGDEFIEANKILKEVGYVD